jgi:uncharacterized protein with GYD domain
VRGGEEFFNLYAHDLLRVAVGTPGVRVGDPAFNAEQTIALMREAAARMAVLVLSPEQGLSARRGIDDTARRRSIMPTYVVLTRLTPEAVKVPGELKRLERAVADHIRKDCPQVKWVANYAILGPYDYLDIFEAPDEITASKVVAVIRSYGHGHTETWTAIPWERFELVLPT